MLGFRKVSFSIGSQKSFVEGSPEPTYSIGSPSVSTIDENGPVTYVSYTITTTNVANGTTLYPKYFVASVNQGTLPSADLDGDAFVTINSNTATITFYALADTTTEGSQTAYFELYTEVGLTNLVATSSTVTINDTSLNPVELTFVAASYATGSLTIAMPSGAQAGDIVFVIDRLTAQGNVASIRTPFISNSGNPFTEHQTTSAGSVTTYMGCRISSRVLTAGALGTISNLINNTTSSNHRTIAVLFRPSSAITSVTYTSTGGQSTTGNPAVQTVSVSNQPQAAIAMAVYTAQSAIDPRTSSITMEELNDTGVTAFYVKYKLYTDGDTRSNFTVDMDDEGNANLLQSFYVKFN
jgi:hypothetical protein